MRLAEEAFDGPLALRLAAPPGEGLTLVWLGQAGFVIDGGGRRVVIDPYLSDSLADKYRGRAFPHLRMMPAPVAPHEIGHVDAVLATHAHTDHLDPGTLPGLLDANPGAVLVAPQAVRALTAERSGLPDARLRGIEAGVRLEIAPGLTIVGTRAAHERIETDAEGRHLFLGLAIQIAGHTILHTGDTVPFEGQEGDVRALTPELILAPVNGRDEARRANGVPGNMTAEEALALARAAGVETVLAHHFDLFEFNTVAREELNALAATCNGPYLVPARTGRIYRMQESGA